MNDDLEPDEYECPGEDKCDDDECDRLEKYIVEVQIDVITFDVMAHSQEQAERLAEEEAPDCIDWSGGNTSFGVWKQETAARKLLGDNETSSGAL